LKNYNVNLGVKREIGKVNWSGFFTLYLKEVKRFTNVFLQTITAPMVTTLLFVIVFSIAIDRSAGFQGIPFITLVLGNTQFTKSFFLDDFIFISRSFYISYYWHAGRNMGSKI